MKTKVKTLTYTILAMIYFSATVFANDFQKGFEKNEIWKMETNGFEGTWDYKAEGAPYEYSTGVLKITRENGTYSVKVTVNYETLDAQSVVVKKGKMNFSVYIEGQKVEVHLTVKGKNIKGEAKSYEGMTYGLSGKKRTDS